MSTEELKKAVKEAEESGLFESSLSDEESEEEINPCLDCDYYDPFLESCSCFYATPSVMFVVPDNCPKLW